MQEAVNDLVERITDHLLSGSDGGNLSTQLRTEVEVFRLVCDPAEPDLTAEPLCVTLRYWQSLPRVEGVPDTLKIDPAAVASALGFLMLIDLSEDETDLRYALYGSRIAETSGFDLTGKSIWESRTSRAVQTFSAACYLAARRLRRPVYSVHASPPEVTACRWHRLILPLGLDGEITRFLVGNVPILASDGG